MFSHYYMQHSKDVAPEAIFIFIDGMDLMGMQAIIGCIP
jgi:hypothetical protein